MSELIQDEAQDQTPITDGQLAGLGFSEENEKEFERRSTIRGQERSLLP